MEQIIEIEFDVNKVCEAVQLASIYKVTHELRETHPGGLLTVRFTGEQKKLEELVEFVHPGDEFEAYMIV